jgi:hypothetical protein
MMKKTPALHQSFFFLLLTTLAILSLSFLPTATTAIRLEPENTINEKTDEVELVLRNDDDKRVLRESKIEDAFDAWLVKYDKEIANAEERLKRLKIFGENYLFVLEHNAKYVAGKVSHYVEMNKFAAHTREEYRKMLGFKKSLRRKKIPGRRPKTFPCGNTKEWKRRSLSIGSMKVSSQRQKIKARVGRVGRSPRLGRWKA